MIIGSHDTFVGIKPNSIISSENFAYFEADLVVCVSPIYSYNCADEVTAQAP